MTTPDELVADVIRDVEGAGGEVEVDTVRSAVNVRYGRDLAPEAIKGALRRLGYRSTSIGGGRWAPGRFSEPKPRCTGR
jgi:copper chaperone CopZ